MSSNGTILVVEDQESARESLVELLRGEGYDVHEAADGQEGINKINQLDLDVVLTDLMMPGADGLTVLKHVREFSPQTLVVLMTAHASVETAVEAIRAGAQDYLLKPLVFDDVLRKIQNLMSHRQLAWENQLLRREVSVHFAPDRPLGRSPAMQEIVKMIMKVAPTPTTVLISGESGVGKEVVARTIHANSLGKDNVFLPVNCSAIPENLLESQLFGHVKGSFTGAVNSQEGLFQRARGGTIFLDEIGEMSSPLQAKLLRVTQDGRFQRVGSNAEIQTNARILASTNRNLDDAVRDGSFREDLFYRLNVVELNVPPLRERREDILPLATAFLGEFSQGKARLGSAVPAILESYAWPGNVRELRNAMERAALLSRGEVVLPEHLPARLRSGGPAAAPALIEAAEAGRLEDLEREAIVLALRKYGYNRTETAKALGISRRALLYKVQRLRELGCPVDAPEETEARPE